jgi:pre-rRNA-processing protein IPI3
MLAESFITSIYAKPRTASTSIAKDVGIYVHTLHPSHVIKSAFKKSSTQPNSLAVSSTHIFAAQAEKAIVHVYSRERGNQETLIPFPERIHSLTLAYEGLLILGTAEGRIILWEVCTGRQVSTPASHLQAVSCLAATPHHLISGSEDSNIHVWSIPQVLSFASPGPHEPLRSLSNHRAAITSIALGHSASRTNICVSASKDNTCIIWNYNSGDLLRTFLLHSTPLCVTLDPCDRALYIGFDNGSIQPIDLFAPTNSSPPTTNTLHDAKLSSTPIQISSSAFSGSPPDLGATHCLALSYDGTSLVSGHASGRLLSWSIGPRKFTTELVDLNCPITNLATLDPFEPSRRPPIITRPITVVKPRIGETALGSYTLTAQLAGTPSLGKSDFESALSTPGIPSALLEAAITEITSSSSSQPNQDSESEAEMQRLKTENDQLWQIVAEQRELQKRTWERYQDVTAKEGDR